MSPAEASFRAINKVKYGGLTVTLVRGSQSTSGVTANLARSQSILLTNDAAGAKLEELNKDFIVRAADYQIGGVVTTPRKGDKIKFVWDGVSTTCELISPPYNDHTHDGEFLRLHSEALTAA